MVQTATLPAIEPEPLVEKARGGDREAFAQLIRLWSDKAYRLALKLTGDPADASDALQEAFLSAYLKLKNFRGESKFSSWLYRIVVNASLMRIRKRKREDHEPIEDYLPTFTSDGALDGGPSSSEWAKEPDEKLLASEARKILEGAIQKLPEEYRTVLVLRDIEELSNDEVAEVLGLSIPAVKSRLHRARLYLRGKLMEHFQ